MTVRDLATLLREAAPVLDGRRFSIRNLPDVPAPPSQDVFAIVREAEGWTVIAPDPAGEWALVALTVPSDLNAVGFTAAFARVLAARSIPANVIAAYHHDHVLVPWDRRNDAMDALSALAGEAG